MELKDVILSTLAEMEDPVEIEKPYQSIKEKQVKVETDLDLPFKDKIDAIETVMSQVSDVTSYKITETEFVYLTSIKERLLVLFEGFQSPNNIHIETKIDMTLNFLEYILSTIEVRLNSLKKEEKE